MKKPKVAKVAGATAAPEPPKKAQRNTFKRSIRTALQSAIGNALMAGAVYLGTGDYMLAGAAALGVVFTTLGSTVTNWVENRNPERRGGQMED